MKTATATPMTRASIVPLQPYFEGSTPSFEESRNNTLSDRNNASSNEKQIQLLLLDVYNSNTMCVGIAPSRHLSHKLGCNYSIYFTLRHNVVHSERPKRLWKQRPASVHFGFVSIHFGFASIQFGFASIHCGLASRPTSIRSLRESII
eukprot:scaffold12042_cov115-Cylindrotheca_fusiformis.AAC.2